MNPIHRSYDNLLKISEKTCYQQITRICRPLKDIFNIDVLSYYKVTDQGKYLDLCTQPEILEDYLYSDMISTSPTNSRLHHVGIPSVQVWEHEEDINLPECTSSVQFFQKHNLVSGVTMTFHRETYREMFYFGAHQMPNEGSNFWYNSIYSLQEFIAYFLIESKSILNKADKYSLALDEVIGKQFYETAEYGNNFVANKGSNGNDLHQLLFNVLFENKELTDRDQSILHGCLLGKSAKQIANDLHLSFRTVQNNTQQLKDKLNCRTVGEMTALFIDNKALKALLYP